MAKTEQMRTSLLLPVVFAGRFGGKLEPDASGVWQFEKDLYVMTTHAGYNYWMREIYATGVTNTQDGKGNTLTLNKLSSSNFPAANVCFQKNPSWPSISGKDDAGYNWYLPAQAQLMALWGVNNGLGDAKFPTDSHWSATESDATYARYVSFSTGETKDWEKQTAAYGVRCVREESPESEGVKVYKDGSNKVILDFVGLPADAVTDTKKYTDAYTANNTEYLGGDKAYSDSLNEKVYHKLEIAPFNMNKSGNFVSAGAEMNWATAYNGCKGADSSSGWRLPTQRELQFMWIFRDALDGIFENMAANAAKFTTNGYWSATEASAKSSWYVSFSTGVTKSSTRSVSYRVRCVREM